jgi:hypothetical protein
MRNDKSKDEKDAGQRTPGGIATRDPEASHNEASPKESMQKHETLRPASPSGKPQRVSFTDSFGACPVSSALDHSARRDPGEVSPTITCNRNH